MFKSLRVPEKLFQLVMWLVSLIFAAFLIGLGSKVVEDLPRLEENLSVEQFADQSALAKARQSIKALDKTTNGLNDEHEQAQLAAQTAGNAYSSARSSFDNWLSTRKVTTDPAQDPEVLARTRQLDQLKTRERQAEAVVEGIDQRLLNARAPEHEPTREVAASPATELLQEPAPELTSEPARAAALDPAPESAIEPFR